MVVPKQPLEGILVLDLGQIYQGPYCGFLLAMAGAGVIKLEPPAGDPVRIRAGAHGRSPMPLAMLNSNKRGISLDLKQPAGKELFLNLVDRADVVLQNFAPGVMESFGLGGDLLCARNPRLVYASGSGYGQSGPYRDYLAMDLTIQAISGMMSVTGFPDGPPVKAGPSVCDFLGGAHLFGAITTALYERERTGRGGMVETSLFDVAYMTLASNLGMMIERGGPPQRTGNRHGGLGMAPYNVYPTSDGYVAIICVKNQHWLDLLKAMGREDLAGDPRFDSHTTRAAVMEEIDALVADWTRHRSKDEVFALSRQHHFPAAPVRNLCEVSEDPHLHATGMLRHVQHPELGDVVLPNTPIRFAGRVLEDVRPNPKFGQDNEEVFCGMLGLSREQFETHRQAGVFGR